MKRIISISAVLIVLAIAIFGCLVIFEFVSMDDALSNLSKIVAMVVLLGGCVAVITMLSSKKDE